MRKGKILFSTGMIGALFFMSGADLNNPLITILGITVSALVAVKGYGILSIHLSDQWKEERDHERESEARQQAREKTWACYVETF